MSARVHLDHAGSSRPSEAVVSTMSEHLTLEARVGGYRAEAAAADRLAAVRADVAALVGAAADEVALVESATRGWTLAVQAAAASWARGDRVLVSRAEFGSCRLALGALADERGVTVEVIPDDADGHLSVTALGELLDDRVRMVAVTHVASHVGAIHPVAEAASLARAAGALVVVDAAQSLGQLPVDLHALGADVLVGTSRKFLRGPRGAGLLVVRRTLLTGWRPPLPELRHVQGEGWRHDATRFEATEASVAVRLGLGVAVRHVLDHGVATIRDRVLERRAVLRDALAGIPDVHLVDPGHVRAATVAFRITARTADAVCQHLAARGVTVSVARPAHTPAGFDRPEPVVRASVHTDTTDDDIAQLAGALRSC